MSDSIFSFSWKFQGLIICESGFFCFFFLSIWNYQTRPRLNVIKRKLERAIFFSRCRFHHGCACIYVISSLGTSHGLTLLFYLFLSPDVGCHARIFQAFKLRCIYLISHVIFSLQILQSFILLFERDDNDFRKHVAWKRSKMDSAVAVLVLCLGSQGGLSCPASFLGK